TRLSACEINATFYRIQSDNTMRNWKAATPEGFRFAVKAHRMISNVRDLHPSPERRDILGEFVRSLAGLHDRLGALMLQFSARRLDEGGGFRRLLDALPPDVPFAVDLKHETWNVEDVHGEVFARGGTLCLSDYDAVAPRELPPGRVGYVRLRSETYDDDQREGWASLLQKEAKERDVYVFVKHEGGPPDDPHVGVGLAQWLVNEIG
ncbi:MAG: DUF72 domain-containing protein, partial [Actinobacteria bacterium]|nr:DUF72 domain-containing protein [Actinomycetota bacterium]